MRALAVTLVAACLCACAGEDTAPSVDVFAADGGEDSAAEVAAPPHAWGTCPEWGSGATPLFQKAGNLDRLVREKHLDDGLLRTVRVDAEGRVTAREHLPSSGLWTAMYLASQAYRYAVTGEQEAVDNARQAVGGLSHLTAVTGQPGLYGRAYDRPDFDYVGDVSASPAWVASPAPGYEGWYFNHDVSKDTMDGILYGYAMALELLDDEEILATVRANVRSFVEQFVADGLQIIDWHGEVTEHGRLYYSAWDDYPGFNALLVASWLRTGIAAADEGEGPDRALVHFYEDCLMRLGDDGDCPQFDRMDLGSYMDAIESALFVYRPDCDTSYDNIDMVFQAIYPLLARETHPALRERLLAVLDVGIWEPEDPAVAPPLHAAGYALYTFLYGALSGAGPEDPVFAAAVEDGVCTLFQLPEDRHDRTIAAGTQDGVCQNRMDRPNAAERIPLAEREYDNYLWRLDPYEIPRAYTAVPDRVHSPEDFLLAYWVGRYYGYLPPSL